MPSTLRVLICAFLALLLTFGPGCSSLAQGSFGSGVSQTSADAGPGAKQSVSSKGEVAKWIFIGTLLAAVVFIDVLILPATYHDPFPCCRAVIRCH